MDGISRQIRQIKYPLYLSRISPPELKSEHNKNVNVQKNFSGESDCPQPKTFTGRTRVYIHNWSHAKSINRLVAYPQQQLAYTWLQRTPQALYKQTGFDKTLIRYT